MLRRLMSAPRAIVAAALHCTSLRAAAAAHVRPLARWNSTRAVAARVTSERQQHQRQHQHQHQPKAPSRAWAMVLAAVPVAVAVTGTALAQGDAKGRGAGAAATSAVANNPEPWTSTRFADRWALPGADAQPLTLSGVGVRCVKGLCVVPRARAYAAALYVDESQMRAATAPGAVERFSVGGGLAGATVFERVLLSDPTAPDAAQAPLRVVRLVFTNDVVSPHVSNGFKASLLKRMPSNPLLTRDDIERFTAVFNATPNIKAGNELLVVAGAASPAAPAADRFRVFWNGKCMLSGGAEHALRDGGIHLAVALLDMWCGPADPISWNVKDNFESGFNRLFPAAAAASADAKAKANAK